MIQPYRQKEILITNYFHSIATVDDFANAYAYMNCICVDDYSFAEEFQEHMEPTYIVTASDNDDVSRGDIVSWSVISEYIDQLLTHGCRDDIECLYEYCLSDGT